MSKRYINTIVQHYESCLEMYGDSHLGVDWPRAEDVSVRYNVMLDVIKFCSEKSTDLSLLDFGCGAAHLLDHIINHEINNIHYSGLDISDKFIELCKNKYPGYSFYCADILDNTIELPAFDYIIMNGVFTEKREMDFEEMWDYFKDMLVTVFSITRKGIAFNVMSKAVDWERDDLFHLSTDKLINFMTKELSRNFIIRNDYGLYEYTVYLYK